jgi:hypothetical protein
MPHLAQVSNDPMAEVEVHRTTCRCWISSVNGGGFLSYGYLGDINTINGEKGWIFMGCHGIY